MLHLVVARYVGEVGQWSVTRCRGRLDGRVFERTRLLLSQEARFPGDVVREAIGFIHPYT
jgi:hypothetical protein